MQNSANADILLDYCARRLKREPMAAMAHHLTVCSECRKFAEVQEQVWSALDVWEAEPISSDFDEKLYACISENERRTFWFAVSGDRFSWKPALSFGAACLLVAIVLVLNAPDRGNPALHQQVITLVDVLEPEQIELTTQDLEMLRQFSTPAQASRTIPGS